MSARIRTRRARTGGRAINPRGAVAGLLLTVAGLALVGATCDGRQHAVAQETMGAAGSASGEARVLPPARTGGPPLVAIPVGADVGAAIAPTASSTAAPAADTAGGSTTRAIPESIEAGIRVYRSQYCGVCHHNTLAGTSGTFGPNHDSLAVNAPRRIRDPAYTGHATTPAEYVRESIRDPGAYRVPGFEHTRFMMPAYTQLPDSDVDALVRMLLWRPSAKGEGG